MSESNAPTVLITGAISGIGFARRLLAGGSTVIVHGPTALSAEKAVSRLVHDGADPLKIDVAVADFTRFGEVVEMAREASAKYRRLDVLVNNAATPGPAGRRASNDGNEVTFQVNYLAPYLLTRLLIDRLAAAKSGRVVNVSSSLHRTANINWADPQRAKQYSPVAAYAQSKLALTMFSKALSTKELGITAVSVHPGVVETDLLSVYSRSANPLPREPARWRSCVRWNCPTVPSTTSSGYQRTPAGGNRNAVDRLWKLSAALVGTGPRGFACQSDPVRRRPGARRKPTTAGVQGRGSTDGRGIICRGHWQPS